MDLYNALRSGDTQAIQQYLGQHRHWHDTRMTDAENDVFAGFSAIHYACWFKSKSALELLLAQQYRSLTQQNVKLPCTHISKAAKSVHLPSYSDCLCICVTNDFLDGAKAILSFYRNRGITYKQVNSFGQTALHLSAVCRNATAKYLITQPALGTLWDHQDESQQSTTFLALAAQAGRFDIFQQIDQTFEKLNSQMKETCAISLLFNNEYGQDLEQYCYCEVEYEKFGTSREEKVKTAILSQKLMKMAHKWLSRRDTVLAVKTLQKWVHKQQISGQSRKLHRITREISFGQSTEDFFCLGGQGSQMHRSSLSNASIGFI